MSDTTPTFPTTLGSPRFTTCASCDAPFTCYAPSAKCWCSRVSVPENVLEVLKATYEDCLCPRCLLHAAGVELAPRD